MQLKNIILGASFATLLSTNFLATADTANRCMAMLDKRVQGNVLELSNCNLTGANGNTILDFLKSHPAITELHVNNNPDFGSEGISVIAKSTSLKTLLLTGSETEEEGFAALAQNKSIEKLISSFDPYNYGNLTKAKSIAGNTALTSVDLSWVGIDGGVLSALATMPTLEEIQIANCYSSQDGLLVLNQLPNLKKLNAVYCYSADDTFAALASNPNLVEFGANVGPKTLQAIINNKNIKKLSLAIGEGQSIEDLKNNQAITSLTLYGILTEETIATVASISSLTELNLKNSRDSKANNLYLLALLPKLQKLSIGLYQGLGGIDARTASALAANVSLKELTIENLDEAAGFELAKSSSLEHLTIQNRRPFSSDEIKFFLNKSLAALAKMPSLTELNYRGYFTIDADVANVMASNSNLKRVHFDCVWFDDSNEITAPALNILAKAKNITDLKLASDNINDAETIALAGNKVLQRLSLESSRISTKGVYALSANQTLTALTLAINPVNASAYNALLSNQAIAIIDVDVNFKTIRKHH